MINNKNYKPSMGRYGRRQNRHRQHKPPAGLTLMQAREKKQRQIIKKSMAKAAISDWYILRTASRKELMLGELLAARDFCVFILFGKQYRRANRFSKHKRRYYFNQLPGYVFIGIPPGLNGIEKLYRLGIVQGIMGRDGQPVSVSPLDIARLAKEADCGGFDAPDSHSKMVTHREYAVDDKVEMLGGPFDGHRLKVIEIGTVHTTAAFRIFGSLRTVRVPHSALVRVDN